MNTPEQLPEGSSLKDAGRKIREIITYLRSLRLTAGQGIRLDHYAAGTTISLSHTPAPTGKSSANEYTGGFRLVDMSEPVKEKDEEGNEVDKVVPKIAVMGVTDPYTTAQYANGTLFFSSGTVLTKCAGVTVDLSKAVKNKPLNVFAYWTGSTGGIYVALSDNKTATKRELDKLMATMYIVVGTFLVTNDNGVDEIVQLFYNDVADFCQGEYTGGFRLVDMSEVVTEEGEDGKETEKVIPKLGVLGVNREGGANVGKGSLYFSLGTAISETSGQIFDCSTSTRDTAQHVFAYWNGYSFGVLTTKNNGMSDLSGYSTLQCVHIGTYKVSDTGIYDIRQFFNGSEVSFQAKQPFLASINLSNQDPIAGYDATLYAYPTPGDLIGSDTTSEETFTGTVFLAENCIGRQYPNKASAWVTVHPVATRIIAAESEQEL